MITRGPLTRRERMERDRRSARRDCLLYWLLCVALFALLWWNLPQ